ncbi:MAG: XRE family transcriptional regulator [Dysgonamonadaceae bacterium]|jgi:hypothetical protein|nr:XRE family transcriptional regulator [Dysgonamonadaceae bacterium]
MFSNSQIQEKNVKHWTVEDDSRLRQMLHSHSLKEIAVSLGRTEMAVKLYIHRERIAINTQLKKNLLLELIRLRFINPELFMPNRKFYNDVKINQNRWWRLYRGDEKLTEDEYFRLAEYFGIAHEAAFEKRQLNIAFR